MTSIFRLQRKPTDRQLRQFGIAILVLLPLLTVLRTQHMQTVGMSVVIGLTLAIAGWLRPALLRPLYVVTTLLTFPLGLIVSELVMILIFFGMLTPLGLLFRLMGRDVMDRRPDRTASSYWRVRRVAGSADSYYRQS